MANTTYFVDSVNGNDGNAGTDMDNAWQTVAHAITAGNLSDGDVVWVRRNVNEEPGATLTVTYDGEHFYNPIRIIGWPRAQADATQADFTNGSRTVDNVVGISMDTQKHLSRNITAPDGKSYFITKVTDANTFLINREYAGSTVTGVNGAFSIDADADYDEAQAIDDTAWIIKVANWTADADDVPYMDFQADTWSIVGNSAYCWYWANFEFRNGEHSGGTFRWSYGGIHMKNCIFVERTDTEEFLSFTSNMAMLENVIIGRTTAAGGIFPQGSTLNMKNVAIYGCTYGIYNYGTNGHWEHVYFGVDEANTDEDMYCRQYPIVITGRDVTFASGTPITRNVTANLIDISIENYNGVYGSTHRFLIMGDVIKTDVVAGLGDPEKRTGGADSVIELEFNVAAIKYYPKRLEVQPIFVHEFEVDTSSKSYRYYVQAEGALTSDEIFLLCEYVSSYDDTSEYTYTEVYSDEAITARTGADDWSQYIEVTGIQPAITSKVRIKCFYKYYHATNKTYVDPNPEIT